MKNKILMGMLCAALLTLSVAFTKTKQLPSTNQIKYVTDVNINTFCVKMTVLTDKGYTCIGAPIHDGTNWVQFYVLEK